MNKNLLFILFSLFFSFDVSAQLFINEVNQGPGGNPPNEYVELVVVGTKTCTDSCFNLQNWILDDNNGFFGTAGIAAGHIRFNSDPQWQCVPYGTIIVIYNALNPYTGIVIDETDANNDNVYFLPSNSSYFEGNLTVPTGGTPSATYGGSTYSAGGAVWDVLGMQNGNDVFQTVSPTNLTTGFHSVGWGSSTTMDIAFVGSASGLLFQNENLTNLDPLTQTNWASQMETSGTPGAGNSLNNIAWIAAMRSPALNCDFCISNATFWIKGDTGTFSGVTPVTNGTVSVWQNQVPNPVVPAVIASGTPQLVQNLPAFNGNSAMFFQNNYFIQTMLQNDAVLDPNQGSMFIVSTTAGLSMSFAVDGPSTGTCGGNRCSSGFRGNRTEYGAANNLFSGAPNAGIANVLSMTANNITNQHFNSVNGAETFGVTVNAISAQAVPYSLSIGRWPGYIMNNEYIAEALAFNRELTLNEVYRVETYLAIKYGVTFSTHNYLSSANNTIWDNSLGFNHNIAGISRDDCFGLLQLKSKSVHPGASLTVALTDNGGTFATPNNFANDLSSLTWGNDNNALTFSCSTNTPSSHNLLLARNWLTKTTGNVGNVSLSFDLTPFTAGYTPTDVALVIDVNQNGSYADETAIIPSSILGNELFFDNLLLTDSLNFSLVMIGSYVNDTITETICDTDSFLFNGNYYYTLGSYTDTIGCDTIRTLNLSVQVCTSCSMDLGNDTLICGPVNYILDAGVFDEYLWQDGSTNQTFTATSTGTYYAQGTNFDPTNLVVNPGFESGNVNFSTDYSVGTGGTWGLISNAGTYGVTTSPSLVHNNFPFCGDHTTGAGQMMVVNGSNVANQAVWCQTITVNPNTDYYFSIWATSVENTNASNVSSLFFELNGTQIGTNFSPTFSACSWQQYTQTWNAGMNTTVDLCIYNHTITGNNDFAIDDIFFGEACIATDTIEITNSPSAVVSDSVTVCFNESAMIFGQMQSIAGVFSDTIQTVSGCDSLYLQTTLFIGDSLFSNQNTTICFSDSIFLENAWQNTTGTYLDTLQSSTMCDSLIYTNLIVSAAPTSDTTLVCSNLAANVGTVIIDTTFNNTGCDSIYNFETTFLAILDSSFSLSCTNNSAMAVSTIDTFRNTLGCDTFYAHIDVTYIIPQDIVVADTCTNILVNEQNFIDTVFTFNGCDSIYRRNTVRYINPDTVYLPNICTNDLAQATINYTDFSSYQGCDSATTAQEIVYVMRDTTYLPDLEICFGNSEIIFGVSQNQSGLYENNILSVGGCDSLTELQSLVVNSIPNVSAGLDTTIDDGQTVLLQATGANTYTWNTGDLGSSLNLTPSETTTYSVSGIDANGCQDIDSVTVFVLFEEINLFVPTAFSPNGDGMNDVFRIVNEQDFEKISLKVYNRWGELVFINDKNNTSWNGTYKNVDQPIENYIYYIEATAKKNQQKFNVSGSVSLIR